MNDMNLNANFVTKNVYTSIWYESVILPYYRFSRTILLSVGTGRLAL